MAHSSSLYILKLDDATALSLLEDILALCEQLGSVVLTAAPGFRLDIDDFKQLAPHDGQFALQYFSATVLVNGHGLEVRWSRDFESPLCATCDKITLTAEPQARTALIESGLYKKVHSCLAAHVTLQPNASIDGAAESTRAMSQMISAFGAQQQRAEKVLEDRLRRIEEERTELEDRRIAIQRDFEVSEAKRNEAHRRALDALEAERQKLLRESHMAERRTLLADARTRTDEDRRTSGLSKEAHVMRWGIFLVAVLGAALSAWMAVSGFAAYAEISDEMAVNDALGTARFEVNSRITDATRGSFAGMMMSSTGPHPIPAEDIQKVGDLVIQALDVAFSRSLNKSELNDSAAIVILLRSTLLSLVSVFGIVWAANWMRGFYRADTMRVRELERYRYDISRASFVLEAVLEAKYEHEAEAPQVWIDRVTRGLFSDDRSSEDTEQGTQAIAALMSYGVKVRAGPDGFEASTTPGQSRKIGRDAQAGSTD